MCVFCTGRYLLVYMFMDNAIDVCIVMLVCAPGAIKVKGALSGRRSLTYTMTVTAADNGLPPRQSSALLVFRIIESNSYAPEFSAGQLFSVSVAEDVAVGTLLTSVAARDLDQGVNGQIRYDITDGDVNEQFNIHPVSGNITVAKPLDYELIQSYGLRVRIRDLAPIAREMSRIFTIDVTDVDDYVPSFIPQHINAYVDENADMGTSVFRAQVHGLDSSPLSQVQYSIVPNTAAASAFSIAPATGVVTTRADLDFESQQQFELVVRALNPGTQYSGSATVTVLVRGVNEFTPVFERDEYLFSVSEAATVGQAVDTVQARDDDAGADGVIEYFLLEDSNDKGFVISVSSGTIRVAQAIDRESTEQIVLTVMAKNPGPLHADRIAICTVRIVVGDANDPPVFDQARYFASVPESADTGDSVITVTARDNDLNERFRFFTYAIASGNVGAKFSIDASSGVISVQASLDRETLASYQLSVTATDTGTPPRTGSTTVNISVTDVNDNAPYFIPSRPMGELFESDDINVDIALNLNDVTNDDDIYPNQGPFRYYLMNFANVFQVGETNGLIKARVALDREQVPSYTLQIRVVDSGSPAMSAVLPVTIDVKDINDNPSFADHTIQLLVHTYQGAIDGAVIANVHPRDVDTVGDYTCRLLASNAAGLVVNRDCSLVADVDSLSPATLTLTGNDGVHADVTYSVAVSFRQFDDQTIENSIVMRITDVTMDAFLREKRQQLQQSIDRTLGFSTVLYSIHDGDQYIDVIIAATQSGGQYVRKSTLVRELTTQSSAIEQETGVSFVTVNYNPCQVNPCKNGAECSFRIARSDSFVSHVAGDSIYTAPHASVEFSCACTDDFTGPTCEIPRGGCDDQPCANGGTCVANGASYTCQCSRLFSGRNCESAIDQCQPNPCANGGTCVSAGSGYSCRCRAGYSGRHCDLQAKTFAPTGFLSYMIIEPQDRQRNSITLELSTLATDALLLYHLAVDNDVEFLALEIVDGRVRMSFAFGGPLSDSLVRLTAPVRVSDGGWYAVTATRELRVR